MDISDKSIGRYQHCSNEWKRDIAKQLVNIGEECVGCGQCVHECPHTAIRMFNVPVEIYEGTDSVVQLYPEKFKRKSDRKVGTNYKVLAYSPKDCTGCGDCVKTCRVQNLEMAERSDVNIELEQERFDWLYQSQSAMPYSADNFGNLASATPFFEFSGACAGCGETKYLGMLSRIFQDHLMVVNATGCSSIYGGTVPYLPWKCSWVSSLFEDAAEVGLGIALANNDNKSVWVVMGDGAAYDIGYGGLDHLMSQTGLNVNVLVLDNGQYSNTGGQASKATPEGESHGLQSGGKKTVKKNIIGSLKGAYGDNMYAAEISMHNQLDCYKRFKEAAEFQGPSIIVAKCHCIMNRYHRGK